MRPVESLTSFLLNKLLHISRLTVWLKYWRAYSSNYRGGSSLEASKSLRLGCLLFSVSYDARMTLRSMTSHVAWPNYIDFTDRRDWRDWVNAQYTELPTRSDLTRLNWNVQTSTILPDWCDCQSDWVWSDRVSVHSALYNDKSHIV